VTLAFYDYTGNPYSGPAYNLTYTDGVGEDLQSVDNPVVGGNYYANIPGAKGFNDKGLISAYDADIYGTGAEGAASAYLDNLGGYGLGGKGVVNIIRSAGVSAVQVMQAMQKWLSGAADRSTAWLGSPIAILRGAEDADPSLKPALSPIIDTDTGNQIYDAGQKVGAVQFAQVNPAQSFNSTTLLQMAAGVAVVVSAGAAAGALAGAGAAAGAGVGAGEGAAVTAGEGASWVSGYDLAMDPSLVSGGGWLSSLGSTFQAVKPFVSAVNSTNSFLSAFSTPTHAGATMANPFSVAGGTDMQNTGDAQNQQGAMPAQVGTTPPPNAGIQLPFGITQQQLVLAVVAGLAIWAFWDQIKD
jgi:hypothetical protein